jgi:hypothetical protein
MASSLIRGVVYSVFDEKIGPIPYARLPATLSPELINLVAEKSIDFNLRIDKVMKQICHIPLPKYNVKMLVKMFQYTDVKKRGHSCATSLALLFN